MAEIFQISEPLTEHDVFNACDALQIRGETVTRRAVYKMLGRGSMTTIARLVSLWEDRQAAQVEARDVDLTAEDSEAILTFGRQMLRTLTDRMRQQAAEETARLTHLADEERRRAIDIAQAYDELVSETKDQVAQIVAQAEQADRDLRTENGKLQSDLSDARDQIQALLHIKSDLEREKTSQTDRANREEKRANDAESQINEQQRQAAEAQGRASILANDVSKANSALDKAQKTIITLERQIGLQTDRADREGKRAAREEKRAIAAEENINLARRDAAEAHGRSSILANEAIRMQSNIEALEKEVSDLRIEGASLKSDLKAANEKAKEAHDRMVSLESQVTNFSSILQKQGSSTGDKGLGKTEK